MNAPAAKRSETDASPTLHLVAGADRSAQVEELTAALGGRCGLSAVLGDLNREAVQQILPVSAGDYGFRWNDSDCDTAEWWPQGISTSADADPSQQIDGRRVVAVSWYAKSMLGQPSRGSRLSFVDITDPMAPQYRHVLLVQPVHEKSADSWSLQPVRVHAGGIAWHGTSILVADTKRGLRLFDANDISRVEGDAFGGYRYVLPQRGLYRAANDEGAEPFRFSFVSLDRSSDPHRVVVGEYAPNREYTTRLAEFDYASDGSGLVLTDGAAHPAEWREGGPTNMQGAVRIDGRYHVSISRGEHQRGSLKVLDGDRWHDHKATLSVGPEDLSYWPVRDEIWCVSEHPGHRYVYAMPRGAFA